METFWDFGYGASLSTLLERTGLSKSSLYQTFGSKDELFARSLTHYVDKCFAPMRQRLEESPSGRAFLEGFVRAVADETRGSRRGCLLMNTAGAMPDDEPLQRVVKASMKRLEGHLTDAVERAQQEGDVDPAANARDHARFLVATLGGLKMLVRSGASRGAVLRAADIALRGLFLE